MGGFSLIDTPWVGPPSGTQYVNAEIGLAVKTDTMPVDAQGKPFLTKYHVKLLYIAMWEAHAAEYSYFSYPGFKYGLGMLNALESRVGVCADENNIPSAFSSCTAAISHKLIPESLWKGSLDLTKELAFIRTGSDTTTYKDIKSMVDLLPGKLRDCAKDLCSDNARYAVDESSALLSGPAGPAERTPGLVN